MKYIILLFFLVPFSNISAQYQVINNPQGVYLERLQDFVKQGQTITKDDDFQFMNSRSVIRVKEKGNIYEITNKSNPLKVKASQSPPDSPIERELKSTFIPQKIVIKTQSRGAGYGSLAQIIQNFEYKDNVSTPMLIIDSLLIGIDFIKPVEIQKKYFYIKYNFDGENIFKKIKYSINKDKISLNFTEELFFVDGKHNGLETLSPVTLFYDDLDKNTTTQLAIFHIVFTKFSDIKIELEQVGSIAQNDEERKSVLKQYIEIYYGKTDWISFIESNFHLLNFE